MLSLREIQTIAAFKPRTWRRATMAQRHQIADTYERTRDLKKAFECVRFTRVELSDLSFETVGARRIS